MYGARSKICLLILPTGLGHIATSDFFLASSLSPQTTSFHTPLSNAILVLIEELI